MMFVGFFVSVFVRSVKFPVSMNIHIGFGFT